MMYDISINFKSTFTLRIIYLIIIIIIIIIILDYKYLITTQIELENMQV